MAPALQGTGKGDREWSLYQLLCQHYVPWRRPVTLSRQWAEAVRQGSADAPAAPGTPRPVAALRRLLARHRLSGAARDVFLTPEELNELGARPCCAAQPSTTAAASSEPAEKPAQAAQLDAHNDATAAQGDQEQDDEDAHDHEEEAGRELAALGLPWLPEHEAQLLQHAQRLCGLEPDAQTVVSAAKNKKKGKPATRKSQPAKQDASTSGVGERVLKASNGRASRKSASGTKSDASKQACPAPHDSCPVPSPDGQAAV